MLFRKAATNLRIQSDPNGGPLTFNLELGGGGRLARVAQYSIVFKAFTGADTRIHAELWHGPDGRNFVKHSDVIGTSASPVSIPQENLLVGDADQDIILNEHLVLNIVIQDVNATTGQWALIEVYEMKKAF